MVASLTGHRMNQFLAAVWGREPGIARLTRKLSIENEDRVTAAAAQQHNCSQ